MNILAIGAHPDDIEIGCAGTLLKLKHCHAANIHALVLTEGNLAHETLLSEQQKSFGMLGVNTCDQLGLYSGAVNLYQAIQEIEKVINEVDPDYIFTHYFQDTHQDHRIVSQATETACRTRNNLLYYESFSVVDFLPRVFVDIQETFGIKLECLTAYKSQEARLNLNETVTGRAILRAHRTGFKRCEAFVSQKLVLWE